MTSEEQKALWVQLAGLKPEELVEGFQRNAGEAYQEIFNRGHKAGVAHMDKQVSAAETAQKTAETAQEKAEGLLAKAPDATQLREQYTKEIDDLKGTHKSELEEREGRLVSTLQAAERAKLVALLVGSSYGVDSDYAEVIAAKPDVIERISVTEEGEVLVLQRGKQIPIQAADGKTPLGLMAEELAGGIDAKWKTSNADAGSGATQDGSGGGGGGKGRWGELRAQQEKVEENRSKRPGTGKTAREKMGLA